MATLAALLALPIIIFSTAVLDLTITGTQKLIMHIGHAITSHLHHKKPQEQEAKK